MVPFLIAHGARKHLLFPASQNNPVLAAVQSLVPQVQLLELIAPPSIEVHTGTAAHLLKEALQ
jgi:hypothetical protein